MFLTGKLTSPQYKTREIASAEQVEFFVSLFCRLLEGPTANFRLICTHAFALLFACCLELMCKQLKGRPFIFYNFGVCRCFQFMIGQVVLVDLVAVVVAVVGTAQGALPLFWLSVGVGWLEPRADERSRKVFFPTRANGGARGRVGGRNRRGWLVIGAVVFLFFSQLFSWAMLIAREIKLLRRCRCRCPQLVGDEAP